MTVFEPGAIVHAPFPHVERAVIVRRPALILATFDTQDTGIGPLAWALMITNAARPAWRGDVLIPDAESIGLLIPSKVRTAKVTTIATGDAIRIGRLDGRVWTEVRSIVLDALDIC
ncbi:hypothetical protein GCM10011380_07590 [Sphingomonas metalli]|uniref:Type II toxin-antitoxin system PemK/MazF family toxin n=1 Tax=Sphingomonas metalli TaxID=1779358 RepID=A0A916SYP2_9SPHN|nr:type II toxin-antitoxin system PemK/MazF family toxin [Sphingomonas metalli]GGB20491.1 hypothetical protein GCM10011380_07590 [Sphingomonas metalli]